MVQHLQFILKIFGLSTLCSLLLGLVVGALLPENYHAHQIVTTKEVLMACYGVAAMGTSIAVGAVLVMSKRSLSLRFAVLWAVGLAVVFGMTLAKLLNAF